MFRLLVVVTVLPVVLTNDVFIIPTHLPEFLWVSPRVSDNKLLQVPLNDKFPSVCLTNVKNVVYYGAISIGTPQHIFKVIFDTTAIHLQIRFLETENPFGVPRSQYNIKWKQYVPYNPSFHVQFHGCNVRQFQYTHIDNEELTDIYNLQPSIPNREYAVFGLDDYLKDEGIKSVFDNMIQQGLVSSRIFSLYINRDTSANLGGKFIFGGSDPAYYEGNFTYFPVSQKGYWMLNIDSIEVKGVTYDFISCDVNRVAIIQTSVWKIIGPEKDISVINQRIGTNSRGEVNCDRIPHLPTITFNFGGKAFDLTGEDYLVRHPHHDTTCITAFWKIDTNVYRRIRWLLGMSFIGRYYTEFDMEKHRVGFALAKKPRN